MKLEVITEKKDIDTIHDLLKNQKENDLFIDRYKRNVEVSSIEFSKETFWKVLIGCLLTTQQNSGPKSAVSRFLSEDSFPLSLDLCEKERGKEYTENILTKFGGIRFPKRKAEYIDKNLKRLNEGGWKEIEFEIKKLAKLKAISPVFENIEYERSAAKFINDKFIGFGPKQSRNLWQWLGYTRFEIPLDSRVIKWLNSNEMFPVKITSKAISDIHYYEMVLDWVQKLCVDADVLPCMLDAAIFSSFDVKSD